MVQLKRKLPYVGIGQVDNTYWAIEARNYWYIDYSPTPLTYDEIVLRAERKERGLLDYRSCRVRELKGFIEARGIPSRGCRTKQDFIDALDQADDDATFTRFLDLPAELRSNIYAKYFEALPVLPLLPHQPPLTLASSLVRAESLPLYYSNCTFSLQFQTHILQQGQRWGRTEKHVASSLLLRLMDKQALSRIRRLELRLFKPEEKWRHLNQAHRFANGLEPVATWRVNLNGNSGPAIEYFRKHHESWPSPEWMNAINQAIRSVLDEIRARPRTHKLRKKDSTGFMRAMYVATSRQLRARYLG